MVVDVVEGVCIQTESVLRQAHVEGVVPVLVLNKMDRLISELSCTPSEAYAHLQRVLTSVNAVCALLWKDEHEEEEAAEGEKVSEPAEEFFSPAKGNVVFACAAHGWAFGIADFATMYEAKLGMKRETLLKTLWGDYFLDTRSKQISTKNKDGTAAPIFAQLCLRHIWDVYTACNARDTAKLEKIITGLALKVPPKDLRTQDVNSLLSAVMSRWLPLSAAVLGLAVDHLPSPLEAQARRAARLCTPLAPGASPQLVAEHAALLDSLRRCDPAGPVIAFISKIFPSDDPGVLVQAQRRVRMAEGDTDASAAENTPVAPFVAFCRIFSGTLERGAPVLLLGPRYDPVRPERYATKTTAEQLYLLMGRALEPLERVPAGNVFGIGGVSHLVLKTATISSSAACTPFSVMPSASHPIVRVAVEPQNPYELQQLMAGLELLNQADPCVEVSITDAGEHLLTAAGEMHLELCLRDLRERYAKIQVEASAPIVPFRESISNEPGRNPELRVGEQWTADRSVCITVQAQPMPPNVAQFLDKNRSRVDALLASEDFVHDDVLRAGLEREMRAAGSKWLHLLPYLWAIGPAGVGTNVIFNKIPDYGDTAQWQGRKTLRFQWSECVVKLDNKNSKDWKRTIEDEATVRRNALLADLDGTIRSGFLMASARGPLCEEPMMGVCFVVTQIKMGETGQQEHDSPFGPLSGQMITAVATACRQAFLSKSARLYEATYVCDVRLTERNLGKVSSVLGRRRAEIFAQEYDTENATITLKALLPVRESFGLYQEMIAQTSGAASVQLMLHDWKLLDMDPFFEAKTEAELEDIGHNVGAVGTNLAREVLDEARRRKGLQVEEKLVEAGDKQRTLSKKK